MRPSLFPSDDSLPTWLHTLLLILIVTPFSAPLFYSGVNAIVDGYLQPLNGPEFGQFFFGPEPLQGKAARIAGLALLILSLAYVAIAARFSRLVYGAVVRRLPWLLLALYVLLSLWVSSLS
ncbi:MAG: hypothetical protein ABL925_00940 [Methylococcales bacterium]